MDKFIIAVFLAVTSMPSWSNEYCAGEDGTGCTYIYQDNNWGIKGFINDEDVDLKLNKNGVKGIIGDGIYEYESDTGIMHYDTPTDSGSCIEDEYGLYCSDN